MPLRWPAPSTMRWLILATLLVFWELMPRTKIVPELFLPSLSKTLAVLYSDRLEYVEALGVTLYEVAIAMLFACGAGILMGALGGGVALLRNLLLPVFSSLYAVPIVILYPIFTAWLGVGSESKIAFAGVYGFFPVMLSTAAGIRTIDPQYVLAARSMGATLSQQITRVVIKGRDVGLQNKHHALYAWLSLFSVAFADLYVVLLSTGAFSDPRFF